MNSQNQLNLFLCDNLIIFILNVHGAEAADALHQLSVILL